MIVHVHNMVHTINSLREDSMILISSVLIYKYDV